MGCVNLTEDIVFPDNVLDVSEAFKNCRGIVTAHSNWDNEYSSDDLSYKNCYMNCVNIETIDENPGTLNEVPREWGGYGFDKDVTMVPAA